MEDTDEQEESINGNSSDGHVTVEGSALKNGIFKADDDCIEFGSEEILSTTLERNKIDSDTTYQSQYVLFIIYIIIML